jgi:hypothetical protein
VNYLQLLVVVHLLDHRFRLLLIESDCIPHQLKSRVLASDTGHRSCHRSLPASLFALSTSRPAYKSRGKPAGAPQTDNLFLPTKPGPQALPMPATALILYKASSGVGRSAGPVRIRSRHFARRR